MWHWLLPLPSVSTFKAARLFFKVLDWHCFLTLYHFSPYASPYSAVVLPTKKHATTYQHRSYSTGIQWDVKIKKYCFSDTCILLLHPDFLGTCQNSISKEVCNQNLAGSLTLDIWNKKWSFLGNPLNPTTKILLPMTSINSFSHMLKTHEKIQKESNSPFTFWWLNCKQMTKSTKNQFKLKTFCRLWLQSPGIAKNCSE